MAYTKVRILNDNGLELPLYLNRADRGWVAQILNGSFGPNREYNFTGNVVTSMSEKHIDINMRLTPTVPIPERPARYFLDYLSSKRISTVEITDPSLVVPMVKYKSNETTTYTPPDISLGRVSPFTQSCVIRELKYNYSECPATIEFTISTKLPIMYGYTFALYMGLGNQTWTQAQNDIIATIQSFATGIGLVDIRELKLSLPAIGNSKYRIFDGDMVIVEQQPTADNGDIVVAMIEDSATVKRFYKEDGNVCCEDLDSTNGIKINGVKLNGKKNKKAVLKEGDCIKIGLEEFYFKQD